MLSGIDSPLDAVSRSDERSGQDAAVLGQFRFLASWGAYAQTTLEIIGQDPFLSSLLIALLDIFGFSSTVNRMVVFWSPSHAELDGLPRLLK